MSSDQLPAGQPAIPSPALTRASELRAYSRAQQLPTRERRRLERPFQLRVRPDRDAVHAELAGELDIAAIDHVRDVLQQLIASGPAYLEIDLRALSFIDASGLRLLLALDAASRRDGWRLSLI